MRRWSGVVEVGVPEQALVAGALDAGVPLGPEALGGQLQLDGGRPQVLVLAADALQLIIQSGQVFLKTGEGLLLDSIPGNNQQTHEDKKVISAGQKEKVDIELNLHFQSE